LAAASKPGWVSKSYEVKAMAFSPMQRSSRTASTLLRHTGVALAGHPSSWCSTLAALCIVLLLGCRGDAPGDPEQEAPLGPATTAVELGRRLAPFDLQISDLSPAAQDQILHGSYLVNGLGACAGCHAAPAGDYLAGGVEFPTPFPDVQGFTTVVARNLTPDPETGLPLTADEFIAVMQTGLDVHDSTDSSPQRLLIMPWHVYRFMSLADFQAMYAYLQHVPPVRNAVRKTFIPSFPFPPVPFPGPADVAPLADPDNSERGLLIPQFFSSGPAAAAFVAQWTANVAALTATERGQVGRGSYLVNALLDCQSCHTDGDGDGNFDSGLRPGTVDVNTAAYLAGGVNLGPFFGLAQLFSRNLTPEPATGLGLSTEQFAQAIELGVDFRRPGHSLRVVPHFPTEYFVLPADLQAVYAFLRTIPAVVHEVEIVP
jgi:mono/diheme cytochrome c family protein